MHDRQLRELSYMRGVILTCTCATALLSCGPDPMSFTVPLKVTVEISSAGMGSGNVSSSDLAVDIDCDVAGSVASGACEDIFEDAGGQGTFTLEAQPDPGNVLTSFTGGCSRSGPSCTVSVSGNVATLTFDAPEADITFGMVASFDSVPVPDPLPPPDGDVVLFDDFDDDGADSRWAVEFSSTDPAITQTAGREATGGNPGGFRKTTHDWQAPGTLTVRHIYQDRTFDPGDGADCAISHLDYSEDRIRLIPVSSTGEIGANLLIRQNGQDYFFDGSGNFSANAWERWSLDVLTPDDFIPAPGPDFSASGGPMEFGYFRSNTTGSSTNHNEHGLDNWRFEIHCVP